MEVDHLVPVAAAQKSRVARQILASIGAESVNDAPNLVPSCHACNARKGSKTGLWLIRGVLGAHRSYWIALRIAQALLVAVCLWLVFGGGFARAAYILRFC